MVTLEKAPSKSLTWRATNECFCLIRIFHSAEFCESRYFLTHIIFKLCAWAVICGTRYPQNFYCLMTPIETIVLNTHEILNHGWTFYYMSNRAETSKMVQSTGLRYSTRNPAASLFHELNSVNVCTIALYILTYIQIHTSHYYRWQNSLLVKESWSDQPRNFMLVLP